MGLLVYALRTTELYHWFAIVCDMRKTILLIQYYPRVQTSFENSSQLNT